jgi:hypothetical protein
MRKNTFVIAEFSPITFLVFYLSVSKIFSTFAIGLRIIYR